MIRLHRMPEMQAIVTDVCGVCPFVCLSRMHQMTPHGEADLRLLHCAGSFGAAFAKLLWPLTMLEDVVQGPDFQNFLSFS